MNTLWLITLAHMEENRHALQITWFSGELSEMLFCMMNMWESICSHIPAITRTQHPLSYPGYASSLFVYTSFQKNFTLTILCNSCCSGHVILAQIWLDRSCFCFAKLKRFVGLDKKKKQRIFSAHIFAVYVEASIGSCCFLPAIHRAWNVFAFSRAVWKGL